MVVKKYFVIDRQAIKNWHYKNDPTSKVCSFSRPAFKWLASALQARIEFIGRDVILIYKP